MIHILLLILSTTMFNSGDYSGSFPILNYLVLEVGEADRPRVHFMRAVAAHQTFNKETAKESCDYLCESFRTDIPRRYENVAWLIREDIKKWEDLGEIAGRMKDVENRLAVAKVGSETRAKQAKIVELLDKKIKDIEDAENQARADAKAKSDADQAANKSELPIDLATKGTITEKELKKIAANWGSLPQAERQKIQQNIERSLPPKYRVMIEEYFRSLNK